jgi:hypothetical protein
MIMTNDDLTNQMMNDIDPQLLEFLRSKVNSFVKWDLVRFFHDNPHTTDTAENIARYTGRDPRIVEPELQQLVHVDVIEATPLNELIVYTYADDQAMRQLIDDFLRQCDNRDFRVKALYHVIQGMGR